MFFSNCFRLVRDFDSELLQIAMASGAVADHRKKILVLSRFHFSDFALRIWDYLYLALNLVLLAFWLEIEAVSGKRVAVVGAGVR